MCKPRIVFLRRESTVKFVTETILWRRNFNVTAVSDCPNFRYSLLEAAVIYNWKCNYCLLELFCLREVSENSLCGCPLLSNSYVEVDTIVSHSPFRKPSVSGKLISQRANKQLSTMTCWSLSVDQRKKVQNEATRRIDQNSLFLNFLSFNKLSITGAVDAIDLKI